MLSANLGRREVLMDRKYDEAVLELEDAIKRNPSTHQGIGDPVPHLFHGHYYTTQDESIHEMAHVDLERSRDILRPP